MGYYGILGGLLLTVLAGGLLVGPFLDMIEGKVNADWIEKRGSLPVPRDLEAADWQLIAISTKGGQEAGLLERIIFFSALSTPTGWPLAASWLAFKLASKWNSWSQLGDLPRGKREVSRTRLKVTTKEEIEHIDDMMARSYRAGISHRRFVTGTAANLVVSLCGVGVGYWVEPALKAFGLIL